MAARFALCCGFGSVSERRETRTTLGTRCCAWPRRPETGGAPTRAKKKGGWTTLLKETSKLKAANSIAKKYPNWREVVWARLVHLKSPWLDHTAIAALTGARPEELRTAKVRLVHAHIYPNINADTDYLGIGICGLVHICTRINSDSRLSRYRHFRAYLHSYKFR